VGIERIPTAFIILFSPQRFLGLDGIRSTQGYIPRLQSAFSELNKGRGSKQWYAVWVAIVKHVLLPMMPNCKYAVRPWQGGSTFLSFPAVNTHRQHSSQCYTNPRQLKRLSNIQGEQLKHHPLPKPSPPILCIQGEGDSNCIW